MIETTGDFQSKTASLLDPCNACSVYMFHLMLLKEFWFREYALIGADCCSLAVPRNPFSRFDRIFHHDS
jgi:hypothetical protein